MRNLYILMHQDDPAAALLLDDDGKELIPYDPDASYDDDDYYDEYEDEDF